MHIDQQPDVGDHELLKIMRPLLIAMELLGGWVYPTVKRKIAYVFRNVYSVFVILVSTWPIIKTVLMIGEIHRQLGYDLSSQMTTIALHIAGFINVMISYKRYLSIPHFLDHVFLNSWPRVNKYRKRCHTGIRLGMVVIIIYVFIDNFSWMAFNIHDLQPFYINFAKPFDKSNVSVWIVLSVTSVSCFPMYLALLCNGLFLMIMSWMLHKSFKKLTDDMYEQYVNQSLINHLDSHRRNHFELTNLVATLDTISAGFIGPLVLMFTFNCCLMTYNLSVSGMGASFYSSLRVVMMSVGLFAPTFYASDKLHNAVSVQQINKLMVRGFDICALYIYTYIYYVFTAIVIRAWQSQ